MTRQRPARSLPLFAAFAREVERQVGRSYTFVLAVGIVVVWAVTGPFFHWSDTWQLIINTGTTIVTFLMVFVIQNTQSRDTQALHLKLDELIRVTAEARDSLVGVEELSEQDITQHREMLDRLADGGVRATAAKPRRPRKRKEANGQPPKTSQEPEATAPAR
jgi:low affinity Fe/Cu permease